MPYHGIILEESSLAIALIDRLPLQAVILNHKGVIIGANLEWKLYAEEHSGHELANPIGLNYLNVCEMATAPASREASVVARSLRLILSGSCEAYEVEYPCHTPQKLQWFMVRMRSLKWTDQRTGNLESGVIICHIDITSRKLLELKYEILASTDGLTGVPNRRSFDHVLDLEFSRSRQLNLNLSVLMIDIDNFKTINDKYGHLIGDEVLRHVATIGRDEFRESDLFARYGGEEFVCLMPGVELSQACIAAERFRDAVEARSYGSKAGMLKLSVSIGVSAYMIGVSSTEELLSHSDFALYKAKADGRNCVWTPSARSSPSVLIC